MELLNLISEFVRNPNTASGAKHAVGALLVGAYVFYRQREMLILNRLLGLEERVEDIERRCSHQQSQSEK